MGLVRGIEGTSRGSNTYEGPEQERADVRDTAGRLFEESLCEWGRVVVRHEAEEVGRDLTQTASLR